MKCTLKLAEITDPKEGQKVITRDGEEFFIEEINMVIELGYKRILLKGLPYHYDKENLFQIVGEYKVREYPKDLDYGGTDNLPVAVKDWQYILDNKLIGKDVEVFEVNETVNGYVYKGSPIDAAKYSSVHFKIVSKEKKEYIDTIGRCANCGVEFHIHKKKEKPVYTEEEVEQLILQYIKDMTKKISWEEWWKNNKKK